MRRKMLFLLLALFLAGGYACKGPQGITEEQKKEQDAAKDDFKENSFDEEQEDE